jgi:transposase
VVKESKICGPYSAVIESLHSLEHPFAVCYEASEGYGYLSDRLRRIARRVVVAHPGQVRLIFRSKRKNDRIDAKKLATLLFLDQVPEVHVPSMDMRSWRNVIEFRRRLIGKRTRAKNSLRSLVRRHGQVLAPGRKLWTRKGRSTLTQLEFPTPEASLQRDMLMDDLEQADRQIKRVEETLNDIARRHPGVSLLQSIPGIGPRTAETVVAYIDKPGRFKRNKYVGSYFGLVPCQDSSAKVNRLGHITREGPATARKFLAEAAWQGIRRSPHIRSYFQRILNDKPDRKKIALVATAHYLVRVMHAMLRTGEVWRYEQKDVAA